MGDAALARASLREQEDRTKGWLETPTQETEYEPQPTRNTRIPPAASSQSLPQRFCWSPIGEIGYAQLHCQSNTSTTEMQPHEKGSRTLYLKSYEENLGSAAEVV